MAVVAATEKNTAPAPAFTKRQVCLITGEYPPQIGGVAGYTYNLAQSLAQLGLAVTVITTELSATQPTLPIEGSRSAQLEVKVLRLLPPHKFNLSACSRLIQHLRQYRYEIVVFQYVPHMYGRSGIAPLAALVPLLLRIFGVQTVWTMFHELWIDVNTVSNPYKARIQKSAQFLQALILVIFSHGLLTSNPAYSSHLLNLERLLPQRKPVVVSPVVSNLEVAEISPAELECLRASLSIESTRLLLIIFSPFTFGKDLDSCLYVLQQLPEAVLVCVGGSDQPMQVQALQKQAQLLGVADQLKIIAGPLPAQEISCWLQAADIYLHPVTAGVSGRSTALAAALQHGMPVVSYFGSEASTIFKDGENLLLVNPGDVSAFVASIQNLWLDSNLRSQLASAAQSTYQQKFDLALTYSQLLNL